MSESLMLVAMAEGCAVSPSLNTLSMTDSSVLVVSRPQKAHQSLTTIPAAITSLPRLTVPAWTPERLVMNNMLTEPTEASGERADSDHPHAAASSFMLTESPLLPVTDVYVSRTTPTR